MQNRKPHFAIENDIKQALQVIENAKSEKDTANAYNALKSHINAYINQSKALKKQYHSQQNTITHQAKKLSDIEIDFELGEGRTDQPTAAPQTPQVKFPDLITVQNNPDFFFIRLSYGFINIRHVIELDVKSQTLFTATGTRNLTKEDTQILIHHIKLYLQEGIKK